METAIEFYENEGDSVVLLDNLVAVLPSNYCMQYDDIYDSIKVFNTATGENVIGIDRRASGAWVAFCDNDPAIQAYFAWVVGCLKTGNLAQVIAVGKGCKNESSK